MLRQSALHARLDQLRRERERVQAAEGELHRGPQTYRARDVRWTASEIDAGPGRARKSGLETQLNSVWDL